MSVVIEATPFPLAEPRLPKADPCVIVIFGALGDLTKRKLVPALFYLACAGCLFYVRTGKRLKRSITEIAVHFNRTPQALFARTPVCFLGGRKSAT